MQHLGAGEGLGDLMYFRNNGRDKKRDLDWEKEVERLEKKP